MNLVAPTDSPKPSRPEIVASGLRVEVEGTGPSRLVVSLLFPVGVHRDIQVRVVPRADVFLRNEIDLGDALQSTFSHSHTTTGGASFFATLSHGRSFGVTQKAYDVVHLPDFRGVRFRMPQLTVEAEPLGLQIAFPVARSDMRSQADFFADVTLEVESEVLETVRLPREIHERAGKVLLVSGYSEDFESSVFGDWPKPLAKLRRAFVEISDLHRPRFEDLRAQAVGFDGIHFFTNVEEGTILVNDLRVSPQDLFSELTGLDLKFVYLATCNSVQVVNSFRKTDISALVATTENLSGDYADEFESRFYAALGAGQYLSASFLEATMVCGARSSAVRGGRYDPMFLDLRSDFRFGIQQV